MGLGFRGILGLRGGGLGAVGGSRVLGKFAIFFFMWCLRLTSMRVWEVEREGPCFKVWERAFGASWALRCGDEALKLSSFLRLGAAPSVTCDTTHHSSRV